MPPTIDGNLVPMSCSGAYIIDYLCEVGEDELAEHALEKYLRDTPFLSRKGTCVQFFPALLEYLTEGKYSCKVFTRDFDLDEIFERDYPYASEFTTDPDRVNWLSRKHFQEGKFQESQGKILVANPSIVTVDNLETGACHSIVHLGDDNIIDNGDYVDFDISRHYVRMIQDVYKNTPLNRFLRKIGMPPEDNLEYSYD